MLKILGQTPHGALFSVDKPRAQCANTQISYGREIGSGLQDCLESQSKCGKTVEEENGID